MRTLICMAALAGLTLAGCATIPNQFVEDGPATGHELQSPTSHDVLAHHEPAAMRERGWQPKRTGASSSVVYHEPLWMEDPFVDKGASYENRMGGEDFIALPYSFARFNLNWLALPASMIVTPPWQVMESDGRLSEQLLGQDHDAVPRGKEDHDVPPPLDELELAEHRASGELPQY